ncbi:RHS repeat-associated core domain-containing protein, partial [Microcoleus sp. herbarium8]|uniref:RHS repeat-associated core domain-containing protein n=1 Tax=Microcoleus sp. herbarium8 TaxID=3055436 RepID=UPI002FCFF07A
RWYSPFLKRFINSDPAGFAGGMNFYAFAACNPISFADPSGLGPRGMGQNFGSILSPIGNAITNTAGMIFGQFGIISQLGQGNFAGSLQMALAIPNSLLNGDIFFAGPRLKSGNNDIYINGIFTTRNQAFEAAKTIETKTGKLTNSIYNPTTYGGDLIQIAFGEFGIPSIPTQWLAQAIYLSGGGNVYQHSQGGNVASFSFNYLPSSILGNTNSISYGAQTANSHSGLRSAINFIAHGDLVPHMSPRNWINGSQTLLNAPPLSFPAAHGSSNYINHSP